MYNIWIVLALASAVFFAVKDVIAKKALKEHLKPSQILFAESLILTLVLSVALFSKVEFSSFSEMWGLYFLKAILVCLSILLYFSLLKKFEISVVSPLMNLSPLMLLFLSMLFLSEAISLLQALGIVIIIFATYILEMTVHHHDKVFPQTHHYIDLKSKNTRFFVIVFLMLVFMSFTVITDKVILVNVNVYTDMFFTSTLAFSFMLLYYLKKGGLLDTVKSTFRKETLAICFFSMISNFLILMAIAVPHALVSLIIPLRRTSTLFSAMIGGLLFHEKHMKRKFFAVCAMIIGIFLIVL